MKVFLHAGMGKAGSSRIQQLLHVNRGALAGRGIYTPDRVNRHHFLAWIALGGDEGASRSIDRNLLGRQSDAELARDAASFDRAARSGHYRCAVLSHEQIARLEPDKLARLTNYLQARSDAIDVILYCRDLATQAVSAINQNLKMGKYDLHHYLTLREPHSYSAFLPSLEAQFGRHHLHVYCYETARTDDDIAAHFLAAVGIEPDGLELARRSVNASLSHEAALIASALNGAYLERYGRTRFSDGIGLPGGLASVRGQPFTIPVEAWTHLRESAIAESAYLHKTFDVDVPVPQAQPTQGELWQSETLHDLALVLDQAGAKQEERQPGLLEALRRKVGLI